MAQVKQSPALYQRIEKNRFSQNYDKERFAFVFFDNQNSYNNALGKKFSYNNWGLVFVEYNAVTCHICSSSYYQVRMYPKNQRKRNMSSTHEVYQQIYSKYGVKVSKPSVGFKTLFARNQYYENQEEMCNWDSANDVWNSMIQGPSSYAKVTKKSPVVIARKLEVPVI
ncbi:hypothetical protein C1646_795998 [Rhizophagus diaphanus]|nr:hypothetical protein C1646_795998 [Rhizophagus diaphanus] [Rhizophagus sp. MUCL 43196]